MKLDTQVVHPGTDGPRSPRVQDAVPGALVHGIMAAASSVAGSAARALASHRLSIDEHALLSRLAGGRGGGANTADAAFFSLCERGLVRYRGGSGGSAASVELTPAGERQLAGADAALRRVEVHMHTHLVSWGPRAVEQLLAELAASTSTRDEPGEGFDQRHASARG